MGFSSSEPLKHLSPRNVETLHSRDTYSEVLKIFEFHFKNVTSVLPSWSLQNWGCSDFEVVSRSVCSRNVGLLLRPEILGSVQTLWPL